MDAGLCLLLFDGADGLAPDGVAYLSYLWPPEHGKAITVRFIGGTPALHERVRYVVERGWNRASAMQFVFVGEGERADVRVSFVPGNSWSYLGRSHARKAQDEASLNLGSLLDGTVLHEFGHALGLKHEQGHPGTVIPWNVPAVYAYFEQSGWTPARVDREVLLRYGWWGVAANTYDPASVMHYNIPAALVLDHVARGGAQTLSVNDVALVRQVYGPPPGEVFLPITRAQ